MRPTAGPRAGNENLSRGLRDTPFSLCAAWSGRVPERGRSHGAGPTERVAGGPGAAPNKDDYVAAAKLLNMALEVQALKEPDLVRGYTEGRRRKVPPFLDRRPVPTEHPRGSRGGAATR